MTYGQNQETKKGKNEHSINTQWMLYCCLYCLSATSMVMQALLQQHINGWSRHLFKLTEDTERGSAAVPQTHQARSVFLHRAQASMFFVPFINNKKKPSCCCSTRGGNTVHLCSVVLNPTGVHCHWNHSEGGELYWVAAQQRGARTLGGRGKGRGRGSRGPFKPV